jgi:hypothetical protein
MDQLIKDRQTRPHGKKSSMIVCLLVKMVVIRHPSPVCKKGEITNREGSSDLSSNTGKPCSSKNSRWKTAQCAWSTKIPTTL